MAKKRLVIDDAVLNTLITLEDPTEVLVALWNYYVEDQPKEEALNGMRLETMAIVNLLTYHIEEVEQDVR